MSGDNITVPPWQESIYQVLKKGGIRQVSYVPDAGHAHVIRRVLDDAEMRGIALTTEEEGVALACGPSHGAHRLPCPAAHRGGGVREPGCEKEGGGCALARSAHPCANPSFWRPQF